ncbi:hypothetical protein D0Z07_4630 [Hyphodiscus hymeniophilus]|uniref:Uncharacterized protein n=1 Tax=Hyphodiscus hymeniophilus TaxID=353542 RepID=A0A9P6VJM0_9HELO|nr:hypothetical protein D0Z07_4630 [Hyphodiscus hymeniophilus]
MEKIKNILSGHKNDENVTTEHTTGTSGTSGTSGVHSGNDQTSGLTSGHRDNLGSSNTTTQNTTSSGLGNTSNTTSTGLGNTQTTGLSSGTAGPHTSGLANKADPRVDSDLDGSRTAGVGNTSSSLGSNQNTTSSGLGSNQNATAGGLGHHQNTTSSGLGNTQNAGISSGTAGPHTSSLENKIDPRVDSDRDGSRTVGGAGNTTSTGYGSSNTTGHTTGDTGFSGNERGSGIGGTSSTTGTGTTSTGTDPAHPHKSHLANVVDPRVDPNMDGSRGHTSDPYTAGAGQSHLGRDATVGAVGGAGAYEAGKHHHGTDTGVGGTSSSTTAGPHSSNVANKADPTVDSDRSKDHHYGRDAGIAGGVGGAAYEADKYQQKHDKDLTHAEREAKKEHKHELKEEKREHKEEKHQHKESKGGLLSFLHRDKSKKYTKEEEDEFDRQEREHNSHKGRDALGGAAVGGAAYEADKHHRDHTSGVEADTNKALPTAPGNHGIGTGAGTQNALAGDNTTSTSSGHHLGRDAAAVGGAGALGEHEHNTHSGTTGSGVNATPLDQKPRGTDLGDKLHGVERNRGVQGSTGFPHESAGSVGHGNTSSGLTGGNQYDNTSSGLTGSSQGHSSHLGRDAAGVGAAGALGEHEHRKHETTTGQQPSLGTQAQNFPTTDAHSSSQDPKYSGAGYDSSNTGFQSGAGSERNRLHKDPPAGHPAAQAMQGEENLNRDTGVANAHGQGGVNTGSNY